MTLLATPQAAPRTTTLRSAPPTLRPRGTGSAPRLEVGPEGGDHLSLRVLHRLQPRAFDTVGSDALVCPVHVHVGGFSGDVATTLRVEELCRFGEELQALRAGERRTAMLESGAGWLTLTVATEPDGTLVATGHLYDEPGSATRLTFRIAGLDAAAADEWVEACTDAVLLHTLPASA